MPGKYTRTCPQCGAEFVATKRTQRCCSRRCGGIGRPRPTPDQTLYARTEKSPTCWEWTGGQDTHGYGQIHCGKKMHLVHRLAYELAYGPIPEGMMVLHECDNRICVNPAHLFLGTNVDNMRDMVEKDRQRPCRGEQNGHAKLTADDVRAIRQRSASGESGAALARAFGVTRATANKAIRRESWRHVA